MRLYLSSFRVGYNSESLLSLLGKGRKTAVIMNAVDFEPEPIRIQKTKEEYYRLQSIELVPEEVDLRTYFNNQEGLRDRLSEYDLIWVRGGNSFLLRRALKQSGADNVIKDLLFKDEVVYGGYSAGAVIMTPDLHGIDLVDNPQDLADGYNPEIIWEGLGLIQYAIVPHFRSNHHESSLVEQVVDYYITEHIPFIALHDGEAIVVNGTTDAFKLV